MRVDVVSIFPEYLSPLGLSLSGKAQQAGLLDVHVHDLREWTHDRHRTVDDTPYGGGAGMVMRPEPWGAALDDLVAEPRDGTVLVVPTPSGEPFTQHLAAELATADRLVFACGRYEGIDQRVVEDAATRMPVREISVGDYVLNGGEVAVLVVIEAVARLLPGFMGNPASLVEESHGEAGLLEYPVYTRPRSWRGLDVPDVLLSGDHDRIARWRHQQAVRRTAARRPDLLHPSQALDGEDLPDPLGPGAARVSTATPADSPELLTLLLACWAWEARTGGSADVPPPEEDPDDVRSWPGRGTTFVVRSGARLVAAVRACLEGDTWHIDRLLVAPDLRGRGLDRWLLGYAERAAPPGTRRLTVAGSDRAETLRTYQKAGYRRDRTQPRAGIVVLSKPTRTPG